MTFTEDAAARLAQHMLTLAKRDAVAARGLRDVPDIDFSIIGFHAQQCVEKCFKSVMARRLIEFPRTHDLGKLRHLLQLAAIEVPFSDLELSRLSPYAVNARYDLDSDSMLDELLNDEQADVLISRAPAWAGTAK